MYSGITSGRVVNGELLYTKILEVNLFAFAYRLFRRDFSPLDVYIYIYIYIYIYPEVMLIYNSNTETFLFAHLFVCCCFICSCFVLISTFPSMSLHRHSSPPLGTDKNNHAKLTIVVKAIDNFSSANVLWFTCFLFSYSFSLSLAFSLSLCLSLSL